MLSIAKLSPGQEGYYERSVAGGLDDYYAGRGESPGIWAGSGAAALGLAGVVADGALRTIIHGNDPATGAQLRTHPKSREITITRPDPRRGGTIVEKRRLEPVAGFDLVFSVPKSVSLLHALGDHELRRAISEAHDESWRAALTYLEDEACVTRRGRNGVVREDAGGFVAAAYQHRTSRAQDPHLHTHVIVANMAQSPDGRWRALDGEAILRVHKLAAGYLYQAHLRHVLGERLGVRFAEPRKGMAEIDGVPTGVLAEFSTRRREVLAHLAEHGTGGWRAAQTAAQVTRDRKDPTDLHALRLEWEARAAGYGFDAAERTAVLRRRPAPRTDVGALTARLVGPHGLTEKQTTFTATDVLMRLVDDLPAGMDATELRALVARILGHQAVHSVGDAEPGRVNRHTTDELLAAEASALDVVSRGAHCGAPAASTGAVEAVLAIGGPVRLGDDQQAMVRHAALSDDRVVSVIGIAGSGKTTATRALAEALATSGIAVVGAAPSGVAARKLEADAGIQAHTLHRLVGVADRAGLIERSVVIIDEAGMAPTRELARLLAHAERADAKVVLVGDPAQLPSVGAGGLFAAIVQRHGAVALDTNRRQSDPAAAAALVQIREGNGSAYLAHAISNGQLVESPDPISARARLLADWWEHARTDPAANVMIAHRRRDVADLNALGRALMDRAGLLGSERVRLGDHEYAAGDRIVCTKNHRLFDVQNGTRATVVAVNPRGTLHVRTDAGETRDLGRAYAAEHIQPAYAITGHASQGTTVARAFVLAPEHGALQEWSYVALSRASEQTRLHVAERTLGDTDGLADLTTSIETAVDETVALDLLP